MSKEQFLEVYLPFHMKVFNWLSCMVSIIHNPVITGVLLMLVASYINGVQLYQVFSRCSFLNFVEYEQHALDLVSNVFNLMFLVRFTMATHFNIVFEILLLTLQSGYVSFITYNKVLENSWDFTTGLFYLQILCPLLINLFGVVDYWVKKMSFKRMVLNANNNLLPVLLTDSFHFVNVKFNLFHNTDILLAYKVLSYSLKFFCLYQYILYEVFNNMNSEFVEFTRGFNTRIYVTVICLLVLVGFDGCYLGLLYYYDM